MAVEALSGGVRAVTRPTASIPSLYIRTGLVFFLAATFAFIAHLTEVLGPYRHNPATLVVVHLFVLGFGTLTAIGAMVQMVPVILGEPFDPRGRSRIAYWHFVLGLALLVSGFPAWSGWLLATGGLLVVVGTLVFVVPCVRALVSQGRPDASRPYMVAALIYLVLTVSFGLLMAHQIHWPLLPALTVRGLPFHVLLGGGGWFTMLIVGVSYKLLPMFSASLSDVDRRAHLTFLMLNGGLIVLLGSWFPGWVPGIAGGLAALAIALILYGRDVVHIVRRRLRKSFGLAIGQGALAVVYLEVAAVGALALLWASSAGGVARAVEQRLIIVLGLLFSVGWIGGMIVGMLSKIVPMLVWMERFAERAGSPGTPTIQDLFDERPALAGAWAYHLGLVVLAGSVALAWHVGAAVGAILLTVGVILNAWALGRVYAWRGKEVWS